MAAVRRGAVASKGVHASNPPGPGSPVPDTGSLAGDERRPRLVIVGGRSGLVTVDLPARGEVVIGREPGCAVCVDEPSLSRRHARLELGAALRVTDLGSRHGTIVRGARIAPDAAVEVAVDEALVLGALTVLIQRPAPDAGRPIWGRAYLDLRLADACADHRRTGGAVALVRVRAPDRPGVGEQLAAAIDDGAVIARAAPDAWDVLVVGGDRERIAAQRRRLEAAVTGAVAVSAAAPDDGADGPTLTAAVADRIERAAPPTPTPGPSPIGPMAEVVALVERIAVGDISVLIVGETGVGKEVVAEHLHRCSRRADRPLLRLHCAALPEPLLESELFGHEKGAFTGATTSKPGLLEHSDGGTVLLDEIGELSPAIQVKLLRVLEQRELLRVGGLRPRRVDVRFVAATHRDLEAAVAAGTFREDLYFRIAGVTVRVPPLRERPAELAGLIARFVDGAARALGRPTPRVADDAMAWLRAHRWPGNVRELRNVVERATLLCDAVIEPRHLPVDRPGQTIAPTTPPTTPPAPTGGGLDHVRARHDELERQAIADALARTGGDQGQAAALLGVSRRTLTNKLNRHGFDRPRKR